MRDSIIFQTASASPDKLALFNNPPHGSILASCREAAYDEGETLFQINEMATHMYCVISGKVERVIKVNGKDNNNSQSRI